MTFVARTETLAQRTIGCEEVVRVLKLGGSKGELKLSFHTCECQGMRSIYLCSRKKKERCSVQRAGSRSTALISTGNSPVMIRCFSFFGGAGILPAGAAWSKPQREVGCLTRKESPVS
eukprot:scaffold74877_cov38-Cyclotella_meneghiniana.AAC.3